MTLSSSATFWGSDKVLLNGTATLGTDLPLYSVVANGPLNGIGLGRNSTVLNYFYSAGKIPSKTWSLWHGFDGAEKETQMDGNLVLGGYDQAKMTGPNVTHSFADGTSCANNLMVEVTDISVNMRNGTIARLMTSINAPPLKACINPASPLIDMPNNLWNRFVSAAGGEFVGQSDSDIWGQNFRANRV